MNTNSTQCCKKGLTFAVTLHTRECYVTLPPKTPFERVVCGGGCSGSGASVIRGGVAS